MRGVFDDDAPRVVVPKRDAELTLGTGTLLAIFLGLVLLCGLCFGLGYEFGRRAAPSAANLSAEDAPLTTGTAKPSAAAPVVAQTASTGADASSGANASAAPTDAPQADGTETEESAPLTASAPAAPRAARGTMASTHSVAGNAAVMVQVASLSDANDAEYLLEALKKRGYPAMVRREAGTRAIDIRVGPFVSRDEANRWRQRLMGDGYNATVMP